MQPWVFSDQIGASRANLGYWLRVPLVRSGSVRNSSTISVEQKEKQYVSAAASSESSVVGDNDGKGVVSLGIEPAKITKADGTEWRWNSFRPWETYRANVSIDLKKHHTPATYLDKMAYWTVKVLRWPTDIFFQVVYKFGSSNSG
ncbi:ubiquinol oxidase 1a, mitochondrial-like [Prosopis cineraria]|uniref:ubiquinol oxidase 1a, mitochondrial-like n=1 Tax=Prosopis cineraria TaxID=364024 RepID=UPI00240F0711|nr:ubiquinol oxidase 1a, mitochondrial-like [Prosopis cineraria]